jgi:hypothetical protein
MTSLHTLIVRLPWGTEYWYGGDAPEFGETVIHNGKRYLVVSAEPSEDGRIVITLAEEEIAADPIVGSPLT